jgi:uncharacterized spore protein YtfJ
MNDEASPNLEPIEKMVEGLGVDTVFGEPIRDGGVTVVPVAEVRFAFGYGYGSGRGSIRESEGGPGMDEGSGGGSGAGGRASARGYVRISADEVGFEPVLDVTRLALAGIAFAAWSVFWVAKMVQALDGRRRTQPPSGTSER